MKAVQDCAIEHKPRYWSPADGKSVLWRSAQRAKSVKRPRRQSTNLKERVNSRRKERVTAEATVHGSTHDIAILNPDTSDYLYCAATRTQRCRPPPPLSRRPQPMTNTRRNYCLQPLPHHQCCRQHDHRDQCHTPPQSACSRSRLLRPPPVCARMRPSLPPCLFRRMPSAPRVPRGSACQHPPSPRPATPLR